MGQISRPLPHAFAINTGIMLFGAMVLFPAFGMLAGKHSSVSRTILTGVWAASSEDLRGGVGRRQR